MSRLITRLIKDTEGQDLIEYGLLVGIITISDLLDLLAEKVPRAARGLAAEGEPDNPVRIRS